MPKWTKQLKGMELCRGCKESSPKREKELNYEGFCTRCIVARERLCLEAEALDSDEEAALGFGNPADYGDR